MYGRSRMTRPPLQYRDGARRVFTDRADIAYTKRPRGGGSRTLVRTKGNYGDLWVLAFRLSLLVLHRCTETITLL